MQAFSKRQFHQTILADFISYLRRRDPITTDDNKNQWLDFGWDVSEGDGEIEGNISEMLEDTIKSLPKIVCEILWWGTFEADCLKDEVL